MHGRFAQSSEYSRFVCRILGAEWFNYFSGPLRLALLVLPQLLYRVVRPLEVQGSEREATSERERKRLFGDLARGPLGNFGAGFFLWNLVARRSAGISALEKNEKLATVCKVDNETVEGFFGVEC